MFKSGFFRSFCLGAIVKVLAWEAVIVALAWLLYQRSSSQRHIFFSDVLLMIGVLLVFFAAFGMLRSSSYNATGTPFSLQVQPTEEEKRVQVLESIMRQKSLSMHLAAIGGLTILLSVLLTYVFHI